MVMEGVMAMDMGIHTGMVMATDIQKKVKGRLGGKNFLKVYSIKRKHESRVNLFS